MRKSPLLIALALSCSQLLHAQEDSVLHAKDSVVELGVDPVFAFFVNGEKVADPSKTIVINLNKKTTSLASLLSNAKNEYADHAIADLDNDGKKELIIHVMSGTGDGLDEIWICKNIAPNRYQYTAKLIGGLTIVNEEKQFIFSFIDLFNRFYTCRTCLYTDTSDAAPIPTREITVNYVKGKLIVQKADQELRSMINDNLGKLGERLTPIKPEEDDDGTRKEIAYNLAVYHYSTGKNLASTKALFNKYYKAADAARIWAAFSKRLQYIASQVSF